VNGRKRHVAVDTQGFVHGLTVTGANVQDRNAALDLLVEALDRPDPPAKVYADSAYAGKLEEWMAGETASRLEIVRRRPDTVGFAVQPKRWIVERTFGWLVKQKRLLSDYESLVCTSRAMIHLAMLPIYCRRIPQ